MRRLVFLAVLASALPAYAERPVTTWVPMQRDPRTVPNLINSHILYLNRCTGGCKVTTGQPDSRTDHSDIGSGNLTAYKGNDSSWNMVVSCVKNVMAPFNITVTDVDPGSADHFEVMIAGDPGQLGLPQGVGGIADYPCNGIGSCALYVPNALVFDFSDVWGGDITTICGTAAQEIAHAWLLDHALASDDPMTYNNYATPLKFRDASQCGSDCFPCNGGGQCTSFGVTCTGSGLSGTHVCTENGQQTQDEIKVITKLFGPAGAKPPDVAIASPKTGSGVQAGFGVDVTCSSNDGVQEVDLTIDGVAIANLTAAPYHFMAPANLKDGTHKIKAMCGTNIQAVATAESDVIVGAKCAADSDCMPNFICYEQACIAGPMQGGGLGSPCTSNEMCNSGSCASDGHSMLCVIPCDPTSDQCPDGFGCLSSGMSGVCWFGADKAGGGCCDSGKNNSGALFAGLGFTALLLNRRRRR